ncbi:SWIM zinc finger family protein [Mycobacterium sp. SM1]|uniref:SWIM zinc finger family protein n=1 Tax=Mycobacterium sp. SM1 TaxID=2816243 RepID=UPI001BCF8697|nr:SWIM zinc finger family protein [Mycobacterium sp. SM1]MBS4728800.1 SWIM zinc finger family protein [Mycobacterium sp. SM1]
MNKARRRTPPRGWYPQPSRPRPVQGGLKARSARGAIAQTWWSQRFVAVLEDIGLGSRLQRGRTYARQGQVIALEVDPGLVSAEVQGSRARPYRVRIQIPAFGKSEWSRVERRLAENAWYAAKLLAGEMPEDIEDVFAGFGLSLFPATARELSLDCACPDYAVPCKHLAAVFYLLAESFDDDPFAILAWRGREREDLLANLSAVRAGGAPVADRAEQPARPLADCIDTYYACQAEVRVPNPPATPAAALLDQLPDISAAVRGRALTELLRPAYHALGHGGQAEPA